MDNMGLDATGMRFNSIVATALYKGKEMNPYANPGATTPTSMIKGAAAATLANGGNPYASKPRAIATR